MNFITLKHAKADLIIHLNPKNINFFFYALELKHTEIVMKNGQVVQAIESPDDIINLIKESEKTHE
jgi:hypothetical protein